MEHQSDQDQHGTSIRRITRDQTSHVFGPTCPPVLSAGRGETIILETQDCYGGRLTDDPETHVWTDSEENNPVTGPVYVEGAEIGDVLCVHIQRIRVASSGIAVIRPKAGILGTEVRQTLVRQVPISGERAALADGVSLPLRSVVGVIGVAPRHGEISTLYPGRHGGNMDTQDITAGTRVYLPVQVKGALLSLGSVKACMGDGKTSGTGVEIAAEITARLDTLPGGRFSWPRLESQDACTTIASASSVEQAVRLAVMEMVRWLEQDKGLDFETAYMVVGISADLRICQLVNPLVTVRVIMPKSVMNTIQRRDPLGSRTVLVSTPEHDVTELEESVTESSADHPPDTKSKPAASKEAPPETGTVESAVSKPDSQDEEATETKTDTTRRRRRGRRRRRPTKSNQGQEGKQPREQGDESVSDGTTPSDESASDKTTPSDESASDKTTPVTKTPEDTARRKQKKAPQTRKKASETTEDTARRKQKKASQTRKEASETPEDATQPKQKEEPQTGKEASETPEDATQPKQKEEPQTGKEASETPEEKTGGSKSSFRRRQVRRRSSRSSSRTSGQSKSETDTTSPPPDSAPDPETPTQD